MATEEKTHQPTPRRREKARAKGQTARSRDLAAAVGLLTGYAMLRIWGPRLCAEFTVAARLYLGNPHMLDFTVTGLQAALRYWLTIGVLILGPLAGGVLVAAVVANAAQSGLLFSMHPIVPDANRLNPVSGLKRLFSSHGLVETGKSCLKLAIVGGTALAILRANEMRLTAAGAMPVHEVVGMLCGIASELFLKCAAMLLGLGLADYAYQRHSFEKQLRMTHRELRDEMRETDGDPLVRSQRARRRRDMLRQRVTPEMAQATVVITNPTHLAVALRYDNSVAPAPRVVAKGQHATARRIKQLAQAHNIPVVQNIPIARALYKSTAVGDEIPSALYQAVAEILAAIYRAAAERRRRREAWH